MADMRHIIIYVEIAPPIGVEDPRSLATNQMQGLLIKERRAGSQHLPAPLQKSMVVVIHAGHLPIRRSYIFIMIIYSGPEPDGRSGSTLLRVGKRALLRPPTGRGKPRFRAKRPAKMRRVAEAEGKANIP